MADIIQSAWGIVYYISSDNEPRYLLIKRYALSKKIERVAPKGKIQAGEESQVAALREVSEETGIPINQMFIKQKIGKTELRNPTNQKGMVNKDVTYFLIEYTGSPTTVKIQDAEGYLWMYKRATITEVLSLLYYQDMRELIRESYNIIKNMKTKDTVKENFIKSL